MARLACRNAKQQHQRFSELNSSDQIPSRSSREQSLPHTGSTRRASLHLWDTSRTLSPYSLEASASNCLLVSEQMQRPLFRLVWQLFEAKGDTFLSVKSYQPGRNYIMGYVGCRKGWILHFSDVLTLLPPRFACNAKKGKTFCSR